MKFLFLCFFILTAAIAFEMRTVEVSADVSGIALEKETLYVATSEGGIELFSWPGLKPRTLLELPKIYNALAGEIRPHIFSIDVLRGKILLVSQGRDGFRNLFIYEERKWRKIIGDEDSFVFAKAAFVGPDLLFIVDLGSEAFLYDLKKQKFLYHSQISTSPFSSFVLNKNRDKALLCDESGVLKIVRVSDGAIVKKIENLHKDNIYMAAWQGDVLFSAGLDRHASYFNLKSSATQLYESPFMVYATALSPSGKRGAFMHGEDSSIKVVEFSGSKELAYLKGHQSPIVGMIFVDENRLISAAEEKKIIIWRIP